MTVELMHCAYMKGVSAPRSTNRIDLQLAGSSLILMNLPWVILDWFVVARLSEMMWVTGSKVFLQILG